MDDPLELGGGTYPSRLIMGTGGSANLEVMEVALIASGTQLTTVAMRPLGTGHEGSVLDVLKKHSIDVLQNTAVCHTAAEAVVTAKLAREALGTELMKVEVVADDPLLLPDPVELLDAV